MKFSKEVAEARQNNLAIVALESTIICHGMPYPQNLETATQIEHIIRKQNCVPATICVIKGVVHIGLEQEELEMVAKSKDFMKLSTRDLSYCLAMKKNGATTVATTTRLANLAGIRVFATGGIGGVHRDFSELLDVSNDLEELGQNQMCIVCAGAKSILDLPKTLEYLETKGVTVFGYNTDEFPAFFTTKSGLKCQKIDNQNDVARVMNVQFNQLNINKCIVIANPIPEDKQSDGDMIEKATQQSLEEMKQLNISGKESTPFLLKRIAELTGNKSLNSNIELVKNNAFLASEIAKSFLIAQIILQFQDIEQNFQQQKKVQQLMDIFNKIKDKVNERRSNYLPTNFYLEMESNGQLPYNTATVKVKAFKDKDKKIEMQNVSFEWFREVEKRKYKIENTSNCHYFSFKDIGAKVLVAVTNTENNSQVEISNFGPIVLDSNIKSDIESMLVQEKGMFEIQLQYKNEKDQLKQDLDKIEVSKLQIDQIEINPREIILSIKNDKITLFHHEYDFVEDFTNPQCFYLKIFKQDEIFENLEYEKNEQSHLVFKVKFLGRVFKEIFCVLRNLFLNVRLMPFLRKLENMETVQNDHKIFNSNKNISYGDLALVFENFKLTLKKNIMYTKKIILEKEALQEQCDNLENDMKTTLLELKEVHKQREFNQMDFSKIEQLETTLIQIEKKKKEKSFFKDSVKSNQILQIQLKKAQDDLEKMKKLNKILLKEIQKKKKSEKIQKMNQSLNNLKEVNSILRQQNFQTQINDTANFSNNSNLNINNPLNNFSKLDQSQVYKDLQELQQENENLKTEMQKLTNKNVKKQLSLIEEENSDQKLTYYQQLFKELRQQIDELASGKVDKKDNRSFLNDSIVESVYQAHQHNQLELLNMENNVLMRRITYLEQEANQQNSQRDKLSRKSKQSYEDDWNQQIDNLREQNTQLMNEIERLRNLELETENVYKKQNQILKQEIEKLKTQKVEVNTGQNQSVIIEEKNKVIQQMQQTINKLVLEVQQLQEEINVNRSLFHTDYNGSQNQY